MMFEQSLIYALGQKELALLKATEQIRQLQEELDTLKAGESTKDQDSER